MNKELDFKIIENKDDILYIMLSGNITLDTIDFLINNIKEIKKKYHIKSYIFNVKKINYVSSGGIGIFMDLFETTEKRGGQICFVGMSPVVRRVFELVGFLQYFGDFESDEDAMKFIKNK